MKKRLLTVDFMLLVLGIACVLLSVALVIVRPRALIAVGIVLVVVFTVVAWNIRKIRRLVARVLHGSANEAGAGQAALVNLQMPVAVLSGKNIVWYNDCFFSQILSEKEAYLLPVQRVAPGLDLAQCKSESGQSLDISGQKYTCFGVAAGSSADQHVLYFVNDTPLKVAAAEYAASRPCVLHIVVDTYDEILKELKESERARIAAGIDLELERFIGKTTGFLKRVSSSRYIAVVEERHMRQIEESRFALLDKVRALGSENTAVTLSIGVGRGFDTFTEAEGMAAQALDMALGRGGDQAAVRSRDGYEFYGGISRSVEKKNKVKSRVVASALADLVTQSDRVLIMGHRMTDLDAIGAAAGVLRFCRICGKPASIVADVQHTLARPLIDRLREQNPKNEFISEEEALEAVTSETLLVVVDTHTAAMLEAPAVYEACRQVVVIDHHRKMVNHIDSAVLFYLEPYASSASELVAEMLPYVGEKEDKPAPVEAEAMLAGIMLDTRNFTVRTGVRTFEAAAYLRRMGAQTAEVQKLFAEPLEVYALKAKLVTSAKIHRGCAIAAAEEALEGDSSVVIPQAANDLLMVQGVLASFVAVPADDQIMISARSMGEVNVQVIMEALGGGGHHTMAGAQLKNVSIEQAKRLLIGAIDDYFKKTSMKN